MQLIEVSQYLFLILYSFWRLLLDRLFFHIFKNSEISFFKTESIFKARFIFFNFEQPNVTENVLEL